MVIFPQLLITGTLYSQVYFLLSSSPPPHFHISDFVILFIRFFITVVTQHGYRVFIYFIHSPIERIISTVFHSSQDSRYIDISEASHDVVYIGKGACLPAGGGRFPDQPAGLGGSHPLLRRGGAHRTAAHRGVQRHVPRYGFSPGMDFPQVWIFPSYGLSPGMDCPQVWIVPRYGLSPGTGMDCPQVWIRSGLSTGSRHQCCGSGIRDPRSGAFCAFFLGMGKKSGSGMSISVLFPRAQEPFLLGLKMLKDRYGKNSDPGSGINIPDPQHCRFADKSVPICVV